MGTKKGIKFQRGFIAGVVAVAVVCLATGLVVRYSSISASSKLARDALLNQCLYYGVSQTELEEDDATAAELEHFGGGVRAYNIGINGGNGQFRFVIRAFHSNKSLPGYINFHIGLTFLDRVDPRQNQETWGGNNDRVYLQFSDSSRLDYIYDVAPINQLMEKTFNKQFSNPEEIEFNVEFQGKNYDGCIRAIKLGELLEASEAAVAEAEEEAAEDEEEAVEEEEDSSSADAGEVKQIALAVRPGFNAFALFSTRKLLDTAKLKKAGMTVWTYNRHGDKKWYTTGVSVAKFNHRIGYYIYSPKPKIAKVDVNRSEDQGEAMPYLVEGWNLMANSMKDEAVALKDIKFYLNPCPPTVDGKATCKTVGTEVKVSDLFIGTTLTQRAYPVIFLVTNPYTSDPDEAFEQLIITENNRETAVIPANTLYWVYVWPQ